VFQKDVIKVDRKVTYVEIVVHVYCKCMFLMFHLCFWTYVASVSSKCCIYFTHMLQVFHINIA
jgi:hypothetical protein